jgi:ubiquinone/menaquinone biosynthesis C-methylase UbiE
MSTTVVAEGGSGSRPARERAYWDDVYSPKGQNHYKYVWANGIVEGSYVEECFYDALHALRGGRVLSLGGGLDRAAVRLAKAGNRVVSVDISPVAGARTRELALQSGVADNVRTLTADCEQLHFPEAEFDAVICKRSLHHMDVPSVVAVAHRVLEPGGMFLAEEPVCLSGVFRWLHAHVPFAPEAPRTPDEKEVSEPEFALIRQTFREVRFRYFDFLARESVAYFLSKVGLAKLLRQLGRLDYFLMNCCCPSLRGLSTYVLIQAIK